METHRFEAQPTDLAIERPLSDDVHKVDLNQSSIRWKWFSRVRMYRRIYYSTSVSSFDIPLGSLQKKVKTSHDSFYCVSSVRNKNGWLTKRS